ncbi:MAG: YggS family pyridoxal phosphate-dependent enzyme [Planctomycetota bacterium]
MAEPTLEARFTEVTQRVADAAGRSGRSPESVFLIAVTKYAEPEDIHRLMQLGHRDFGESRVQQLVQRASVIAELFDRMGMMSRTRTAQDTEPAEGLSGIDLDKPVRWHMIGHLQKNKARKVAEQVRLVHSIDNLRVAEELHHIAGRIGKPIDVLVQVNMSGEASKSGCGVPAAQSLCEQIDNMIDLNIRGLMTMAPYSDNPEDARPHFARTRELFEDIQRTGVAEGRFNLLSMGMSGDYEVAIEEGANLVRVGSAIFGEKSEASEPAESASDSAASGSPHADTHA